MYACNALLITFYAFWGMALAYMRAPVYLCFIVMLLRNILNSKYRYTLVVGDYSPYIRSKSVPVIIMRRKWKRLSNCNMVSSL